MGLPQQPIGLFSRIFAQPLLSVDIAQKTKYTTLFGALFHNRENQTFPGFDKVFCSKQGQAEATLLRPWSLALYRASSATLINSSAD